MAFVPEDGTGLPNANSMTTVAYADEYFADRGNTAWDALFPEAKQAALISGTSYANTQYVYKGEKLNPDQGCAMPRTGVTDPAGREPVGVPDCVQQVVCELAIRASKGPLIQDPTVDEGGRPVKMKMIKAGPLVKQVEYAGPGEYIAISRYPAVDSLMCPWLIVKDVKFANGVKIAGARIEGISNSRIDTVAGDSDRYTGPMNENNKDVEAPSGNSPF